MSTLCNFGSTFHVLIEALSDNLASYKLYDLRLAFIHYPQCCQSFLLPLIYEQLVSV